MPFKWSAVASGSKSRSVDSVLLESHKMESPGIENPDSMASPGLPARRRRRRSRRPRSGHVVEALAVAGALLNRGAVRSARLVEVFALTGARLDQTAMRSGRRGRGALGVAGLNRTHGDLEL